MIIAKKNNIRKAIYSANKTRNPPPPAHLDEETPLAETAKNALK
jgi:hypothetical protein